MREARRRRGSPAAAIANAANQAGDTALHVAARSGYDTVVQLLVEHGARVNVKNKRGITPLDRGDVRFDRRPRAIGGACRRRFAWIRAPDRARPSEHRRAAEEARRDRVRSTVRSWGLHEGEKPARPPWPNRLRCVKYPDTGKPVSRLTRKPSGCARNRYESANELAEDLRRYLNDEPTSARPIGGPIVSTLESASTRDRVGCRSCRRLMCWRGR